MKKKFLSIALVTATMALAVMPSAMADESGTGNSSSVSVASADGTIFSLTLSGNASSAAFTTLAANATDTTQTLANSGDDYFQVIDDINVALPGHTIDIVLDTATWTASGNHQNSTDLAVHETSGTVPSDSLTLEYLFDSAYAASYVSDRTTGDNCDANGSAVSTDWSTHDVIAKNTSAEEIVAIDYTDQAEGGSCNAKWTYYADVKATATDLYAGEVYSIEGTATAYNGNTP